EPADRRGGAGRCVRGPPMDGLKTGFERFTDSTQRTLAFAFPQTIHRPVFLVICRVSDNGYYVNYERPPARERPNLLANGSPARGADGPAHAQSRDSSPARDFRNPRPSHIAIP